MHCAKCGAVLADGAKFCTACGTPTVEAKHTATVWRRFSNLLVDIPGRIIFDGVLIVVLLGVSAVFPAFIIISVPLSVLVYFGFVYYVFFESIWQRTPGKWATGTKVVRLDGTKPGFWQIVGRSLCRWIPFEPLSFLFGEYPFGWHDRISKTMVVPAEYSAAEAASVNPQDKGKSSGALILIIVVSVFLSIAVIGILASIVLVSLNSARAKGADAAVMSYVNQARVAAELAAVNANGYLDVCNDPQVSNDLTTASQDGSGSPDNSGCSATQTSYILAAPLKSGGYYCADSTGNEKTINDISSGGTSCGDFPAYQPTQ